MRAPAKQAARDWDKTDGGAPLHPSSGHGFGRGQGRNHIVKEWGLLRVLLEPPVRVHIAWGYKRLSEH